MENVEYIIGSNRIETSPLAAYSDEAMEFMSDLSRRILKHTIGRAYPDVAALGFWCRKGNLTKMRTYCPEHAIRLGRGLCFHVTPSNIPINFAFSYLFGLLAGCANIVRLPSKRFAQAEFCLKLIGETLKDYPGISCRTAFVCYPADRETTGEFSMMADARIIWGGDHSVSMIRSLPVKPKCVDVVFADRYSICIIDGNSVLAASDEKMRRLADDFYNDTYLMDQNACSSPHVICWLNDSLAARERFWSAVNAVVCKKYAIQGAVCVDKYTQACRDAILRSDNITSIYKETNLLYRVELTRLTPGLDAFRGKGGYFYEYAMLSIDELATVVTEKYQTVTFFGIRPEDVRNVVMKHHLKGIDRVTPIGNALDIGVVWDGYDLVRTLSRIVNVE